MFSCSRSTIGQRVLVLLFACNVLASLSSAGQTLQVQAPSAALIPSCSHPPYTAVPPPPPDVVQVALNQRNRYRLVIGVGENSVDASMNRTFVDPTAAWVDSHLAALGFKPLPSFMGHTPYLAGPAATKQAIMAALSEMESVTTAQDYGVIYYVGHGSIALSNNDLTLGVYDRPVARDDGIRVSDVLGTLEFGDFRSDITEIPHYVLILDACFSGNAAIGARTVVGTTNNVQRLQQIQGQIVPPQIAIIAATSDGDSTSAYELHGTNASAFGYYFGRALNEDWACSDAITPDGILTLNELTTYIKNRLKLAADQQATDALMVPTILNKDMDAFIAYDATKHAIDGLRAEIVSLEIQPTQTPQVATVTLPSGREIQCTEQPCTVQVSRTLLGLISVRSTVTEQVHIGAAIPLPPRQVVKTGQVDLQQLLHDRRASVAAVQIQVE